MSRFGSLQLVRNSIIVSNNENLEERLRDHEAVILEYLKSKKIRGHKQSTINNSRTTLERFFTFTGKLFWDITIYDVAEYIEVLDDLGLARSTRYSYIKEIELFYKYVLAHPWIPPNDKQLRDGKPLVSIEIKYGVSLNQPIDRWILPPLPADDFDARELPSKDQLRDFFAFIRNSIPKCQKTMIAARDYAVFRTFYGTGIRCNELLMLDVKDVRFDYESICVRYGKGSKGRGYKPRWVPMWNGVDNVLQKYLATVRPTFRDSEVNASLFLAEGGKRISARSLRDRLVQWQTEAKDSGVEIPRFMIHDIRRMFATHAYEEQPERLRVLQEVLGHSFATTTQRYLRPSKKYFIETFGDLTNSRIQRLKEKE